jgi:hypothetical protein
MPLITPSAETLREEVAEEEVAEEEVEEEAEAVEETIPQQPRSSPYPKQQTFEQWENNQKASTAIGPKQSNS